MNLVDATLIGSISMMVVAGVFLLRTKFRGAGGRGRRPTDGYLSWELDLWMALFWMGMLLMQLSQIWLHWDPIWIYHLSPLTFAATACALFACGVFAGRLLLRLEIRRYQEKQQGRA